MGTNMVNAIPYTVAADQPSTSLLDSAGPTFRSYFKFVPHYELVNASRYICFVPLITTWALLPEVNAPIAPNHHIFSLIHDHIIKAAAEERCLLILDTSSEGDPLIEKAYRELHSWLAFNHIPDSAVLLVNQNRTLGEQYGRLIGGNLRFGYYDSFVKRLLNVFSLNDNSFEERMGFSRNLIHYRDLSDTQKAFLYLNGAPRSHRIVVAAALLAKGILADATWSMLGTLSNKLQPSGPAAKQLRAELRLDWVGDDYIDAILSQMPKLISGEAAFMKTIRGSDQLALLINPDLFNLGFASIVTETEFSSGTVNRISEITLKPIMMGHPIILFGNPFSLKLLRDFGFNTFDTLIDEAYDSITDPGSRVEAAVKAILSFQASLQNDNTALSKAIGEVCIKNIYHAQNTAARAYEESVESVLLHEILTSSVRV
jgi:hypothetical protein